jgi:hypothetical protein
MTVRQVLRTIAAPGSEQAIIDEDKNGDGRLCIKIVPNEGGPPQFDPAFVFVDNHIWRHRALPVIAFSSSSMELTETTPATANIA